MTGWRVPGRIEVLGKHTDYAGGRVLVAAVDRGVTVRATAGADGIVARSAAFPDDVVTLRAGVDPGLPPGPRGRYLQTVVDRLALNFGEITPCELEITHDLPPASGMSSSSALLCAVALTLADLSGFTETETWRRHCPDRLALAGYLAAVENGGRYGDLEGNAGVGTSGGSLDHTGMLATTAGEVAYARFDPMELLGSARFPADWRLVVGVSGVLAEKTGAARELYNRGPQTLRRILARWNERSGRADTSIRSALDAGAEFRTEPGYETARLAQFVEESERLVPAGYEALRSGDMAAFADVVNRSHAEAVEGLGNNVPETDALVALARELGAPAATQFGAGFGGSAYALVRASDADAFASEWLTRYQQGRDLPLATTLVTQPSAPAERLD